MNERQRAIRGALFRESPEVAEHIEDFLRHLNWMNEVPLWYVHDEVKIALSTHHADTNPIRELPSSA